MSIRDRWTQFKADWKAADERFEQLEKAAERRRARQQKSAQDVVQPVIDVNPIVHHAVCHPGAPCD